MLIQFSAVHFVTVILVRAARNAIVLQWAVIS